MALEIIELDSLGPARIFHVKGVTTPGEAIDAVKRRGPATVLGGRHPTDTALKPNGHFTVTYVSNNMWNVVMGYEVSTTIPGRNPPETVSRESMQPMERATCFLFGTLGNVEHRGRWCAIRVREGPWVRTYCGAMLEFDVCGQLEGEAGCPLCLKEMRQAEQGNHPVGQPEPVDRRPEPTPLGAKDFSMYLARCVNCNRGIRIPYLPGDKGDIIVPLLCTECTKDDDPKPVERKSESTSVPPMSGSITEDDVARWFGIPPDKIEHFVRLHKQFKAAREWQEDRLREACRIAGEWFEAYIVGGQDMPTPPGYVGESATRPPLC